MPNGRETAIYYQCIVVVVDGVVVPRDFERVRNEVSLLLQVRGEGLMLAFQGGQGKIRDCSRWAFMYAEFGGLSEMIIPFICSMSTCDTCVL